jgi:hypothetical protein
VRMQGCNTKSQFSRYMLTPLNQLKARPKCLYDRSVWSLGTWNLSLALSAKGQKVLNRICIVHVILHRMCLVVLFPHQVFYYCSLFVRRVAIFTYIYLFLTASTTTIMSEAQYQGKEIRRCKVYAAHRS